MLGWARQLVQYYPLKSRILHFATVLSSYSMPARRTVASYMIATAAWSGDREIQTVEEQRSVVRLRASLVDAVRVRPRAGSKKRAKQEVAQMQRMRDVLKKKLDDFSFSPLSNDAAMASDLQLKRSAKQDAKQDDCSQPPGANARNVGRRIRVKSACPLYVRPESIRSFRRTRRHVGACGRYKPCHATSIH